MRTVASMVSSPEMWNLAADQACSPANLARARYSPSLRANRQVPSLPVVPVATQSSRWAEGLLALLVDGSSASPAALWISTCAPTSVMGKPWVVVPSTWTIAVPSLSRISSSLVDGQTLALGLWDRGRARLAQVRGHQGAVVARGEHRLERPERQQLADQHAFVLGREAAVGARLAEHGKDHGRPRAVHAGRRL